MSCVKFHVIPHLSLHAIDAELQNIFARNHLRVAGNELTSNKQRLFLDLHHECMNLS